MNDNNSKNDFNNAKNNFNRYTFRDSDGTYLVSETDCYATEDYYTGDAIERLAKYEDSVLSPEQVMIAKNIIKSTFGDTSFVEHTRELLKAEKEGRLIILDEKPISFASSNPSNPCLRCDIGWGKVSENGCISCKDDCLQFKQYNETLGEFKK